MLPDQLEYYRRLGEVERLTSRARGRLEYVRTREIVERVLTAAVPDARAVVLDVGGGTGIHAQWLAEAGHDVHLIDPVAEQVAIAARLPGVRADVGDARNLPVPDAGADLVLLLGPLYHLLDRSDRVLALREAYRALRPGGMVIGAVIPRSAVLVDMAARARLDADTAARLEPVLATGQHDASLGFTAAYFHRIEEIAVEFADAGFEHDDDSAVELIAVEGVGIHLLPAEDPVDPTLWDSVLRLARRSEHAPELLAGGSHVLAVARRPG